MSKTLSFLDKSFWITESDDNPKHVGCLQLLEMPEGAKSPEYVPAIYNEIKGFAKGTSPFNCVVKTVLGYPVGLSPVKHLNMFRVVVGFRYPKGLIKKTKCFTHRLFLCIKHILRHMLCDIG